MQQSPNAIKKYSGINTCFGWKDFLTPCFLHMSIDSNGKALHLGFQMQGLYYVFESNNKIESMCY